MNTHFSQSDRQGRLKTILSDKDMVLLRLDGTEELSGDFEWRVSALATTRDVDLHALLGTHAVVEIDHVDGSRVFSGIICEATASGSFENGHGYELVLRPWLHVASMRRNMRIFHEKTVIEIVQEVLESYSGLCTKHFEAAVQSDYPVLEYTVQYGESDADFCRRQLERHGISWHWVHAAGGHTMRLVDRETALPMIAGGKRAYRGVEGFHRKEEHFNTWSSSDRVTTGAVRLTEYNFKAPSQAQEVSQEGRATHPFGDVESFDWPGDYLEQTQGKKVVDRRTQEERGQAQRHRAAGDVLGLAAGTVVEVAGDELPGVTGESFICLKAHHQFRAQAYGSGESGGDETPYEGAYVFLPIDAPLRPERRTIGPRVHGPETAVVVGDGEIDCDEYGRILCKFHWDLDAAHTMRVRVSQNWAGKGWGGMVIPRIGMEVIVEHLRGDPDKPIVTGCVFNGKNDVPYELPEHKTRSTFKTDTHQGTGFNELRFEDKNGEEEIFLHAQKDRNTKVENNQSERVNKQKVESVGENKAVEVGANFYEVVDGDMELRVGPSNRGAFTPSGASNETQGIPTVPLMLESQSQGSGNLSVSVQKTKSQVIGENHFEEVEGHKETLVNKTYTAKVRETVTISAGDQLDLICGQARITMKSDGTIEITGKQILETADKLIKLNAKTVKIN